MKITLSKTQYKDLIHLAYLGTWLANSVREPGREVKRLDDLEQYLYSYAKEYGLDELVEFDKASNKFFPTRKLEDDPELNLLIDRYDEDVFWEELTDRLSVRDLFEEYGDAAYAMPPDERLEREDEYREKYEDEFAENGIKRLEIGE